MILQASDFTDTSSFYRIPMPLGVSDAADLDGCIAEGEKEFCETFNVAPADIADDALEALKYFTFAFWLRMQGLRKTAAGAGAKINFTQSQNYVDTARRYQAYNRACSLMGREDKKMFKIINY